MWQRERENKLLASRGKLLYLVALLAESMFSGLSLLHFRYHPSLSLPSFPQQDLYPHKASHLVKSLFPHGIRDYHMAES